MVATPASFALLLVMALTAEVTTRSASAQFIDDAGECTTVNEGMPEACPPIQPSRSRQRTRWTVVVLAQRRPRPLARLLSSIERANLSAADVNLRIEVRVLLWENRTPNACWGRACRHQPLSPRL